MPRTPEEYKHDRTQFSPIEISKTVDYIFLCESPPSNGGYFYDIADIINQFLFRAMMQLVGFDFQYPLTPIIKEQGLRKFQSCGFLLMDAIYDPVNELNQGNRNLLILANYANLVTDLHENCSERTRIIIVKTTLYDLLYTRLIDDNFNVINGIIRVPFPSTGQQTRFHQSIEQIKQQNNIVSFCQRF